MTCLSEVNCILNTQSASCEYTSEGNVRVIYLELVTEPELKLLDQLQ